ncbi:MAG: hypothetical protein QM702_20315 [Rubrivivax sp.]
MKHTLRTTLTLLAIGLFTLSSCNKLKDLAKVTLNIQNEDGEFDIPATSSLIDIVIESNDVHLNLDSMISAQNSKVSSKNVKEVHIKSCQLKLTNGTADNNFSALQSCKLEVKSNVNTTYIALAQMDSNPDSAAYVLNLPVNDQLELKDYFLSANTFSYRISGKTRKPVTAPLHCQIIVNYSLVAGL